MIQSSNVEKKGVVEAKQQETPIAVPDTRIDKDWSPGEVKSQISCDKLRTDLGDTSPQGADSFNEEANES